MKIILNLAVILVITILFGVIYIGIQQVFRTSANDPQIELTREVATRLQQGKPVDSFFSTDTIDIEHSDMPFLEVADALGNPIRSTGLLKGKMPQLPSGVIEYVMKNGEDGVTWQPYRNVRMAMIIQKISSSSQCVIAGRSLTETENRVSGLSKMLGIGWIISIAIVLMVNLIIGRFYGNDARQLTT